MAVTVGEAIQLLGSAIAIFVALGGLLWKVRQWQKNDMEQSAQKHIGPVRTEQKEIKDSLADLKSTVTTGLDRMDRTVERNTRRLEVHEVKIAALDAVVFKRPPDPKEEP